MCLISVVLATYNGQKFIEQQLQSIITQLPLDSEIIISDDKSVDRTIEIIEQFNDTRIKIIENHKRKGTISNFENGLKHASGNIIFLSDQDDVWLPNKVETVKKYLQEYDLVMSDCKIVDENLEVLQDSLFASLQSGKGFFKNLISNTYIGCCIAFKKNLLKLALPFPKNIPMHDIWLGMVAELFFSPQFINDKLVLYRRHELNKSSTSTKSVYALFEKLKFRYNTIRYIPLLLKRKFLKN